MTASNPELRRTSVILERAAKAGGSGIWEAASRKLTGQTKNRVEVNLGRLSRVTQAGDAVFVPGKVLGTGLIDKKLVVGAFAFSASARAKLEASGGSALTIPEFLKKYPKGSGVRLVE